MDDLLPGSVRPGVGDVLRHRAHEDVGLLGYHGHIPAQLLEAVALHVDPVHQHLPFLGVIEPGDQVHQRGLAGAGAPHDAEHLPRLHMEADILQDRLVGLIAEGHVPQLDLAPQLPGPQGIRHLLHLRHRVDDLEHALGGVHALGVPADGPGEKVQGPLELSHIAGKRDQQPQLDVRAADDHSAAHGPHQEADGILHGAVQRIEFVVIPGKVHLCRAHLAIVLLEAGHLLLLLAKSLHHPGSREVLVHLPFQAAVGPVPLPVIMPQMGHHPVADHHQHRHQDDGHQRKQGIQQEHDDDCSQYGPHIDEEIRDAVYQEAGNLLRVVGHPGHQAAGLPLGIEADGQPPHGGEHLALQRSHHRRCNPRGQHALEHGQPLENHLCDDHGDDQNGQRSHEASGRQMQQRQELLVAGQHLIVQDGSA